MAELKTKKNSASVIGFLNKAPEPQRSDAKKLLTIFRRVTGMRPAMWGTSIIGFGSYHYKSERSNQEGDWPLTGFSARKQNLTVYIMAGAKKYQILLKKLGKFKVSGGSCIYVKRLSDIHVPTLEKIVKQSVRDMQKKYRTSVK